MAVGYHSFGSRRFPQAISGNTIFTPGGDGALWALDVNTAQVQWTYHAGFNVRGHTALYSSPAVDETNGWVIGIADTGHMFVLNKDTGRVVKEAFLGVTSWKVFDPHPDSGYWIPGPSGLAIVPSQGLLYVAATDYDRAWKGMGSAGREKLFCYDYLSDPNTLTLLWEYQFCADDDCSEEANEYLVRGHDPYVVAWYSMGSPALADGHVYFASHNGKIYCFGSSYTSTTTTTGGQPCPAEVIYGVNSKETKLLGYFKDSVLSQTQEGRTIIELYYMWSPAIVDALSKDKAFRAEVKEIVDEFFPRIGSDSN